MESEGEEEEEVNDLRLIASAFVPPLTGNSLEHAISNNQPSGGKIVSSYRDPKEIYITESENEEGEEETSSSSSSELILLNEEMKQEEEEDLESLINDDKTGNNKDYLSKFGALTVGEVPFDKEELEPLPNDYMAESITERLIVTAILPDPLMIVVCDKPGGVNSRQNVLDVGNLICNTNKVIIGRIGEVFGPVKAPYYLVRFMNFAFPNNNNNLEIVPKIGDVLCTVNDATKVVNVDSLDTKGTDKSNVFDQEAEESSSSEEEDGAAANEKSDIASISSMLYASSSNNNNNNNNSKFSHFNSKRRGGSYNNNRKMYNNNNNNNNNRNPTLNGGKPSSSFLPPPNVTVVTQPPPPITTTTTSSLFSAASPPLVFPKGWGQS